MKFNKLRYRYPILQRPLVIGYVVGLLVFVAAYSRTELPPFHVRLRIAIHEGGTGVPLLHTVEAFSAMHDVEIVLASYDQLYDRELAALKSGSGGERFDVIMLDDPWLARFATPEAPGKPSLLRPLEGKLQQRLAGSYFEPVCSRVCQIPYCDSDAPCAGSQHYYAVPFVANTQLFARGPGVSKTLSDWDAVELERDRLDALGGSAFAYAMRRGPGNSIVTDFMPVLWSYCPDCWRSRLRPLTSPGSAAAVAQLLELSRNTEGKRKPGFADESLDDFDLSVYWVNDAAHMGLIWSSWAMSLENIRNSEGQPRQRIDYGVVPGGRPTLGAWLLAIPANARYPEVAEEFLYWATDVDRMTRAAYQGNPPPVRGLLASDKALQQRFYFYEAQQQALDKAHPRPRTPCWKDLETQIGRTLYRMTAGLFTPQAAQAKINEELAASPCSVTEK